MGRFIEIVTEDERNELKIDDSVIYYRRFDAEKYREIERRHTRQKGRDRTGAPIIDTDNARINDDVLDYLIIDWKDVIHPTTQEKLPCTREWKLRLPTSVRTQILQVSDAEKTMKGSEDEQKKTSENTSDS